MKVTLRANSTGYISMLPCKISGIHLVAKATANANGVLKNGSSTGEALINLTAPQGTVVNFPFERTFKDGLYFNVGSNDGIDYISFDLEAV